MVLKKTIGLSVKDKLKLRFSPKYVIPLLRLLGFSWETIGFSKIGYATLITQIKHIVKNSETDKIEKTEKPKKIVFLTMLGGHVYNASIDVCLALSLQKRGHHVTIVLDDQTLPITQEIGSGQEKFWERISARNYEFAKQYFGNTGLNIVTLSYLSENYKYKGGQQFNEILEASLLRHYKVGIIKQDFPLLKEVKKLFEKAIEITSNVGQGIVELKPDLVIMSHGIYSTWGPPFKIIRNNEIPILTYARGKKAGTSKFNWNCTADWWDVTEAWQNLKNRELTKKEEEKIDAYLHSRIKHSNDVFVYNFGDFEDKEKTFKRFNLDPQKNTYSLFTNVLWDAASAQREIAFLNPIEWVIETIKWFENHPDKQLIVKIHPAEQVIGTNMPFMSVLKQAFKQLPNNVRVIEPYEEVNSWSIYQVTDLGLVHTTTVGMELALVGIPCVVVSKTHFREKGFTIDVNSKEEYFKYLKTFSPDDIDRDLLKKQSKKYAYLLFEKYQMPLDLFNEVYSTDVRSLRFNSIQELYNKPTIRKVINAIETGEKSILND